MIQINSVAVQTAIVAPMSFAFLKRVVLVFALLALPLQALAAAGPGGCPGATDAAMAAMHDDGSDAHHDGDAGHAAASHAPLCGACPAAGAALPPARQDSGAISPTDAPLHGKPSLFQSFSPPLRKRPPLASA